MENPPVAVTLTAAVPDEPFAAVTDVGEALNVKPGVAVEPSLQWLANWNASTEPSPVARS